MSVLDTQHKRKSAIITAVILILFILGIFNFGMQYLDPPEEYGVAINFGDMNVGSGVSVLKSQKTTPKEEVKTPAVIVADLRLCWVSKTGILFTFYG